MNGSVTYPGRKHRYTTGPCNKRHRRVGPGPRGGSGPLGPVTAIPVAMAEGLADAPRSKLRKIKISPNGLGLHWPLLDADLYVPGLIEGAFGSCRWMQQIGKLGGGSSRSSVKAKASRENGKRGGRPKEKAAA
jgi:hypothetical protein